MKRLLPFHIVLCLCSAALAQSDPPEPPNNPPTENQPAEGTRAVDTWQDADAEAIQKLLAEFVAQPNVALSRDFRQNFGDTAEIRMKKNFPTMPYLTMTITGIPEQTPAGMTDEQLKEQARALCADALGQRYFSQEFADAERGNGGWSRPELLEIVLDRGPVQPPPMGIPGPFDIPFGLTTDERVLLCELGYIASPASSMLIAYTPANCREIAIGCIRIGRIEDAVAVVNHALRYEDIDYDASLLYVRAYAEISMGMADRAVETLELLRQAGGPKTIWVERLNGPPAVNLLLAYDKLYPGP